MKSYFLIGISRPEETRNALSGALPGQTDPWLLLSTPDDPIAYFNIASDREIQVDVSGRHYNEDAAVVAVLEVLTKEIGGTIEDDRMALFVLDKVARPDLVRSALAELLPGPPDPWILFDTPKSPIGYFHVESPTQIWVWVSSRHSVKPTEAVRILKRLQSVVGGIVTDSDDQPVD